MADNNKPTYNPQTNSYSVGKFNVPGQNLNPSQRAGADRRYNTKEFFGGLREGFADIGKGIKQNFDPRQKGTQARNQKSVGGDLPPSVAQTLNEQTRIQTSSLLSIDAKLEDIVLSQRTIQQDVNRLVFLVEEMKGGIGRDRNFNSPESTREVIRETGGGGNDKSILDMLLDSFGGPDRGRSRNRPNRQSSPSRTSRFFSRGALFNPLTLAAGGLATLAYNTGQARRQNPEAAEQFDRTLKTGGERSQVIQGPEAEREQFKDQPLPERAPRLTDEQKKQWLALPSEEKRKFQNNPTEWLKTQQNQQQSSGDNTEILLTFSESTDLSNVLTNYSITNRKTGEVFSKENGLPLINFLKIKKLSEKLSLFRGELRNSPVKKDVVKELQSELEEAKKLTKQNCCFEPRNVLIFNNSALFSLISMLL